MAILTGFVRRDRHQEIDGCPLADGGDEAACARCPYNALEPGKARVGCQVQTPSAEVEAALARLATLDPAAHASMRALLDREQQRPEAEGLSPAEVDEVAALAARWGRVVGGDVGEHHVVALLQRFTAAARKTGEPIRVLA